MDGLVDTFSNRLKIAMKIRNIKATELSNKTGIAKSSLSEYINGKYEAKQDGVYLISKALNINEAWLMGCDVPMERITDNKNIPDINYKLFEGLDIEGLDEDDLRELQQFIEFKKNLKKKKK